MGYSVVMTMQTDSDTMPGYPVAPDITPGYPSKGEKVGPAWNEIYAALVAANDFQDGRTLANEIAPRHDLNPATLIAILSRAAFAGLLDKQPRPVASKRGMRNRTHYRVH